jgi:hypothetical protein
MDAVDHRDRLGMPVPQEIEAELMPLRRLDEGSRRVRHLYARCRYSPP